MVNKSEKVYGPLLWKAIKDIQTDCLITDCIIEELPNIFDKLSISTKKINLCDISKEELGSYLLPWYTSGTWFKPTNYRVKSYPKKIKLKNKKDNIIITVIYDTKNKEYLIVDGCHRAVAYYQSKNIRQGYVVVLSSPKAGYIAMKDFGYWRK